MSYYPPDLRDRLAALAIMAEGKREAEYQDIATKRGVGIRQVKRWMAAFREEIAPPEPEDPDLEEDLLLAERERVTARYQEALSRGDRQAARKLLAEKRHLEDILHDINGWIFLP